MKTLMMIVATLVLTGCAQYGSYRPVVDTHYPTQQYSQMRTYPVQNYPQQFIPPAAYPSPQPIQNQNLDEYGVQHYRYYDEGNPQYRRPMAPSNPYPSYQNYQQGYYQQQSYQQPVQNYPLDEQQCQQLAEQSSSIGTNTLQDGFISGLVGAGAGAALGAIAGDPGKGAMYGSVAAIPGAAYGAYQSDQDYKSTFANCMKNRGYNVLR